MHEKTLENGPMIESLAAVLEIPTKRGFWLVFKHDQDGRAIESSLWVRASSQVSGFLAWIADQEVTLYEQNAGPVIQHLVGRRD